MRRQASLSTVQTGQPAISLDIHPTAPVFAGTFKNLENHTMSVVSFPAWTAGQQISVHSLGEGPRGAGLENRSVSDVIPKWDLYGICKKSIWHMCEIRSYS